MADWNPELYRRFEGERTRAAADLLRRVGVDRPTRIVDVGCGPGNSTELLVTRFAGSSILGIDTSPAMIETARKRIPGSRFDVANLTAWKPAAPLDLVYANAVLQWVPDHPALMTRLLDWLAPAGWLAFQVPDNRSEPTHTLMREAAAAIGRRDVVAAAEGERADLGSFENYWEWLAPRTQHINLWRTTYVHPLAGHDAVVAWLESTGLRPYLSRLDPSEGAAFKAEYRRGIEQAYPLASDGKVLLRFPRLFVVAQAV